MILNGLEWSNLVPQWYYEENFAFSSRHHFPNHHHYLFYLVNDVDILIDVKAHPHSIVTSNELRTNNFNFIIFFRFSDPFHFFSIHSKQWSDWIQLFYSKKKKKFIRIKFLSHNEDYHRLFSWQPFAVIQRPGLISESVPAKKNVKKIKAEIFEDFEKFFEQKIVNSLNETNRIFNDYKWRKKRKRWNETIVSADHHQDCFEHNHYLS